MGALLDDLSTTAWVSDVNKGSPSFYAYKYLAVIICRIFALFGFVLCTLTRVNITVGRPVPPSLPVSLDWRVSLDDRSQRPTRADDI